MVLLHQKTMCSGMSEDIEKESSNLFCIFLNITPVKGKNEVKYQAKKDEIDNNKPQQPLQLYSPLVSAEAIVVRAEWYCQLLEHLYK